jgi:hypothetical protein
MSTPECVERDERTVAVENAGYRWAFLLLSYTLLVDVMYRSLTRREASWDLLSLVVAGGAVCTLYQARRRVLTHGWLTKAVLTACLAGVVAAVFAMTL